MAEYYAVERSQEYLEHYGIKGMRWGVRKAKERGDSKRLAKHYAKAKKKYDKLMAKANIARAANNAYAHRAIGRVTGGLTGIQAGLSGALIAEGGKSALPLAAFFTGPSAVATGIAGANYLKNKRRMSSKGHEKAVKKVKEWESEVNKAFKGTSREKLAKEFINNYKDDYSITELKKGKNGFYEKTLAKIPGSHLTTDYKGKDKQRFLKIAGQTPGADPRTPDQLFSGTRTMNHNNGKDSEFGDPMAFNYNYHSLTRKRKDKKIPWYRSSTSTYREYKGHPKWE